MGMNTILGNVIAMIASFKNAMGYRFESCSWLHKKQISRVSLPFKGWVLKALTRTTTWNGAL